ncbi:MAG: HAMP domain-containing histidine kinase [Defluviitaleaceae bacterium]|nr:HAMP domain-containing histidine kinase [Defluviitaleaceae bacterium]
MKNIVLTPLKGGIATPTLRKGLSGVAIVLTVVKIVSTIVCFLGALSFLRSFNRTFDWHMQFVHPRQLNYDIPLSLLAFFVGLAALTYAVWQTKNPKWIPFIRRMDFFAIALVSVAVIYACYQIFQNELLTPWEIYQGIMGAITVETFITINMAHFRQYLVGLPIVAYAAGILMYMEFIARLRDKNMNLHWFNFFKSYSFWPSGVSAALMLGGLVALVFFNTPDYIKIAAVIAVILSGYFAEYLLTMSQSYALANAEKIQAERFKSELITNVSHDIKTPLTSIINYVDLLKNEGLQGQAAEYLQVLDKKSARLKVLIDDLMEASKAGTGNLDVQLIEIDLGELVGQVAGEFEDAFFEKSLTLVIRQPDEPMRYSTDTRHLYRILENLFSNASKYALSGTRVFAEITQNNGKPHLVVQNTSVSPLDLSCADATEQFMRGDKSRQTEGSGLGLYIAKSLAELMGGSLLINISGDLFRVDILL